MKHQQKPRVPETPETVPSGAMDGHVYLGHNCEPRTPNQFHQVFMLLFSAMFSVFCRHEVSRSKKRRNPQMEYCLSKEEGFHP